jgi:hypothetical protein
MRFSIPILTFLLFLCGLLIFFGTLLATGIGFYTPILTGSAFIGFVILLFDKKLGQTVMLFVSAAWLLRYFEHASYLILYDPNSSGRWFLTIIPLLFALPIFGLTLREKFKQFDKTFKNWYWGLLPLTFLAIGLFSFLYKPHTDEFNCWYYFDDKSDDYKISFAITPDHIFETTANSPELKEIVIKEGLTYEGRDGYYWPETKVRVTTRFKKIIGVKILGFRNSEIDKKVRLENPFEIDLETIKGDKSILEPEFNLGD